MKHVLYRHPDGGIIEFDGDSGFLLMEEDGYLKVGLPIGPAGLIELGEKLIYLGRQQKVAT